MSDKHSEFELLLQCYKSGQVSESQWQEHLKDEAFKQWLESSTTPPKGEALAPERIWACNETKNIYIPVEQEDCTGYVRSDIYDKLEAELATAKQRGVEEALQGIIDWADLVLAKPKEFDNHGVMLLSGPAFDAARRALKSGQADG